MCKERTVSVGPHIEKRTETVCMCACIDRASQFMCVHLCVGVCAGARAIWQMVILDKEILRSSVWLHSASTLLINTYLFP